MTIRTRFAPSPTGYLHIGGARTALYSWLHAKKTNGLFILRIEDTDLERSNVESVQAILDGMSWLGLTYDEGPFYQTQRFDRYREVAERLLNTQQAYRCYCTKERLDVLRQQQMANKEKPRYDGHCRHIQDTELATSHVIRFRNPETGEVHFQDQIRGSISFNNQELDDLIIVRSDGTPTYNFTVVVDDWDMRITHVIRGDDHINNTPRQINILQALGAAPPVYAHVPMILGADGKRLSKRHGAVSVMQYRDDGFLPQAVLNYLIRLGWSHGDQEIFSEAEMVALFDLKNINRAPAAFNDEKLLWLNQHYLKTSDISTLLPHLAWHFTRLGIDLKQGPPLADVLQVQRERVKTLKELAEKSRYFYTDTISLDTVAVKALTADSIPMFNYLKDRLQQLSNWTKSDIHQTIASTAEKFAFKLGKLAQPLRIIVTGGTVSPPIDSTLRLLGKTRTITRITQALASIDRISI